MNTNPSFLSPWQPQLLGLLRIVTGYCFILHGTAKLLKVPHDAMFDNLQLFSLMGLAGVLELVGGFLIIIGLFTRPVAFILAGEMAFAYFMGHASQGTPLIPMLNRGEPAVLFCFIFLYLSASGPGAFSVDNAVSRPRTATAT
ncbi:MAG TPA: DoxX family protein [Albitalea sp.]